MRGSTSSLVFVFCVAAGTALSACSGETTENPGGGGGSGGSGGAGTTSSTTASTSTGASTSSTTTAATTTASSGSGGAGDVCDQACARAAECGSPICDQFTVECSDPQYECIAQCVLDAEGCENIGTSDPTFVACALSCDDAGGAGGGNSGGDCRACALQNNCLTDCLGNTSCQTWLLCTQGCFESDPTPECFRSCDTAASAGANGEQVERLYRAAYACTCTSCEEACEAVADPCSQ
ncbi:hypothetical protein WMF37_46785 [Sorangium sp. So ce291]|uniref:hypothetical protein n=1 Tax=Sorangium sp. So ce291 TaxID=3133294 RepID=UPI003F5E7B14